MEAFRNMLLVCHTKLTAVGLSLLEEKCGFLTLFPLAHSTPIFRAASFETQSPRDAPAG